MVGIVTGNGLGLQSSSLRGLGDRGVLGSASFGQTGERIYVNASNGNLMIQDRDQLLLGQGVSSAVYRAYNSLAQLTDGKWVSGGVRTVSELSGALGTAGSTIVQTDWDGSRTLYAFDVSRGVYVSSAAVGVSVGDALNPGLAPVSSTGAHATIRFDAATNSWVWRDGRGQATETYDAGNGGRLVSSRDVDGNSIVYGYNAAGRLAAIGSNTDAVYLDYDAAGNLIDLNTTYRLANGQAPVQTAVRYTYDALGRLLSVTVDLTPEDSRVDDGHVFTTTYGYDGDSNRVASLAQSDGSRLSFTYTLDNGLYRVATITQAGDDGIERVTRLQYDLARQQTTITDPLGFAQQLSWDTSGRLTGIRNLSEARSIDFQYDGAGNLVQQNDTLLGKLTLSYDAAGNLIRQSGLRSDITRTYGANNELLTETVGAPYPATGFSNQTTRYAYDALGHLRYIVSAEGRVAEYRYNSAGQRISEIHYAQSVYDVSALATGQTPSLASLDAWVGALDSRQNAQRIDSTYDWRGNLAVQTRYDSLLADGSPDASGYVAQTRYVYDPQGHLLQRYVGTPGQAQVEQFAYDALGRLLSSVSFDGALTTYQYDDAHHAMAVTFANGLVRTSTYNAAGELVLTVDSTQGRVLSQVRNWYDPDGRLRMSTDADGRNAHYLYNSRNQLVAVIAPDGKLTETVYDAITALQLKSVTYATRVSAAQLATLVDAAGRPVLRTASGGALTLATANVTPVNSADDRWLITARTNASWVDHTIDSYGVFTQYQYDSFGKLVSKTVFANRFDPNVIPPTSAPAPDPEGDRTTRYLYDGDGLMRGEIDARGYLTETRYNAAGERSEVIRYANPVDASLLGQFTSASAPPLAVLIPSASGQDLVTRYVYNARGLLAAEIDGEGYVTRYQYDARGNVTERVRGQRIAQDALTQPQQAWVQIAVTGAVGAKVNVVVDGVPAGTITLTASGYTGYSLPVPNLVALAAHTVEFDVSPGDGVTIHAAALDSRALSRIVTHSSSGLRYTLDAAALLANAPAPSVIERSNYSYDAMGRLLLQIDAAVAGTSTTRYTFDAMGRVLTETLGTPPHARTVTNEYDVEGRLVRRYSAEASQILASIAQAESQGDAATAAALRNQLFSETYSYDAAGQRIASTDALGRKTLYYYDDAGQLTVTVNAAGEVVQQSRTAFGDLEQTTVYALRLSADALGRLQGGRLTAEVAADFTALDSTLTSRTRFKYNATGGLVRRTDALGQSTDYVYDSFGEVAWQAQDVGDGSRRVALYQYDRTGNRLWQLTDATGLKLATGAAYDAFGRVIQSTDANGVSTFSEYDHDGRVIGIRDSAGHSSTRYDAFGNVMVQTDRLGNTTTYSYDAAKRQINVMTLDGVLTTTTYNEQGQVVALTDGRGNTTVSEYDLDGRLVKTTSPTSTITYAYDHAGQRVSEGDAQGARIKYTYDLAGRVLTRTQLVSPWDVSLTTRYEYDAKGQRTRIIDPSGTVTETRYDALGRQVRVVVDPDGLRLATTFQYDAAGHVLTLTEGEGSAQAKVTRDTYDTAGRLVERLVDPSGLKLSTRYAYDAMGNAVAVTDATGAVTHYVYDDAGRQTWSVGPTGAVTHFERDAEGRIVTQESFAAQVAVGGMPERMSALQLLAMITRSASDQIDRRVYDAVGRQRYAIDALGHVKEQVYDGAGNVVRVIAYAGPSDPKSLGTGIDHVTRMVYDSGNRLIATIDANGMVTRNLYDADGNVRQRIQYDVSYAAGGDIDPAYLESQMRAWSQSASMAGRIHVTSMIYDQAKRLRYTVDAEGYVTENRYDGAGRLVQVNRYAQRYPEAAGASANYLMLAAHYADTASFDQAAITHYRYDGAGRLVEMTDAQQVITQYVVDELGRATDTTVAAGTRDAATTHLVYDHAGNVQERTLAYGTAIASTTRYTYDGVGRQLTVTDARSTEVLKQDTAWTIAERQALHMVDKDGNGLLVAALSDEQKQALLKAHTSTRTYDAAGRLIAKSDGLQNVTRYQYDAFGNQVSATDPMAATTVSFYDKLNRVVAQVSPENWVVGTAYDAFGNVSQVIDYVNARPALAGVDWARDGWRQDVTRLLPASNPQDAITKLEYDKLGRLTRSIDGEGYAESYTYDGFGNRVGYTSKAGGAYTYTYDGMGRMLSETLPVLSGGWPVVNRYEYDARGNRITSIEAQGLGEERVTHYRYDLLDRKVSTTRQVELAGGTAGTATETSVYDARGDLIKQIDANGNAITTYYDAIGHKTGQVSPSGVLTLWAYDATGNLLRTRIFGDPVQAISGPQPPSPIDESNVRETRFLFDADGRMIRQHVINVASGAFSVSQDSTTADAEKGEYLISSGADLVTQWEYDGRGLVISKTDPSGYTARYFYNGSGQKILDIDAAGYGIAYELDARGNVKVETRFAMKRGGDPVTSNQSKGSELVREWPRSADDRITEYTWDRDGRKTSESRLNVKFASVDGYGKLTQQVGNATKRYVYDGDGHVLSEVDENGSQYDYQYDALGHRTSERLPAFTDNQGRYVRVTTVYEYDGLGNLRKETRKGDSDQVTSFNYGAGGRLKEKVYAVGGYTAYDYDGVGNVVSMAQSRNDADGQNIVDITVIRYDTENREIYRSKLLAGGSGSSPSAGTQHELRYDAYGEIVARRTNGGGPNGEWQEYADYDNAGRVVRTNLNDGISHLYMYDKNGNATLKVESMDNDLRSFAVGTQAEVKALLDRIDMMQTFTRYDRRNQVLQIRQPKTSAGQPRVSFAPVGIQIDGGQFANTVLRVKGWIDKDRRPVLQPIESLNINDIGVVTDNINIHASAQLSHSDFITVSVSGIRLDFPPFKNLYGNYDVEVRVEYSANWAYWENSEYGDNHFAENSPPRAVTQFFSGNPQSVSVPINFDFPDNIYRGSRSGNTATFRYKADVYLYPRDGPGIKMHLGTLSRENLVYKDGYVTDRTVLDSNLTISQMANTMTVAHGTWPDGALGMIYYRPAGSNGQYGQLPMGSINNVPHTFTAGIAGLSNGNYEMIFLATDANGNLLRRDGYSVVINRPYEPTVYAANIPDTTPSSRAGFSVDGSGTYIWTRPQILNIYTPRDSAGNVTNVVTMRVRRHGTEQWGDRTGFSRDPVTGGFKIDMSGYSPGYWDVEFDLIQNSPGTGGWRQTDIMRGVVGFSGDNTSPSFSMDYLANLDSSLVFAAPPATAYIDVSWEQDGKTKHAIVGKSGEQFIWNVADLIPTKTASYKYSVQFTTYDAGGKPLTMGGGDITLAAGYGTPEFQLTKSSGPTTIEFKPSGYDGLPLANASTLTLSYRPSTSSDHDYDRPFTTVTLTRDALGRFLFDAKDLPTNVEYEYRYVANDAAGKQLLERESYFETGTRNNPNTNTDIIGVFYQTLLDSTVDRGQLHNAFGEISSERDGRGNWTTSEYNTLGNLVLKREPQVSVTLANGVKVLTQPETTFYYDRAGNLVGKKDANGNLSTQQWNYGTVKPSVAVSWDALGNARQRQYDNLGNMRVSIDEIGRRTDYQYDAKSRLIEVDQPVLDNGQRSVDRYEYDSLDQRIAHTDAMGGRARTYYDADGRIIRSVSAAGRQVRNDYAWSSSIGSLGTSTTGGWVRTTTDANGTTVVDENDLFGRLITHTDLGRHVFRYQYNWAGLVTRQTGTSGQDVNYTYYSNGLVRAIYDNGTQTQALYEYDGDGNRTAEYFTNTQYTYVFSQSRVKYDALNRITAIEDDSYKVYYEYDAVGNRRRMTALYTDMVGSHARTQDYWYEYDALNRFTVTMGSLSGPAATDPNDTSVHIVAGARGSDGVQLSYNAAGERATAFYAKDGRFEKYVYDTNGYLRTQEVNGIFVQERENDLLGRVKTFVERDVATGKQVTGLARSWDADGMLNNERDQLHRSTTTYKRMADGTLQEIDTTPDDANETSTVSTYAYEWWDSAKQSRVTTQATSKAAPGWKPATSYFNYDVNGNLKRVFDDGGNDPGNARAFQYWTDLRGQVQRRDELKGASVDASGAINGTQGARKHNYYYLNGNRIGNQGNDGIDQIDYMQELAGKLGKGSDDQFKVFTPIGGADFDENYMPINGVYPSQSPGQWTVRSGDTLKSVAAALWGDSSLWYILADANGLKDADELRQGQLLTVPNKVTNIHNNATTFKPYDPGRAIGDTQPTLPAPPPPPSQGHGGCGGFMSIIAVVVAVAVTVVTGGSGAGVVPAMLGGAVASAASQGVMMLAGEQKGFDWRGVGMSALAAGVTAGLPLPGASATTTGWQAAGQATLQGAARSVVTQGLGVVTGLQHNFDWRGVAAGAIASGIGYGVGQASGQAALRAGYSTTVSRFVSGVTGGLSAGVASTLVRGGDLGRNIGAIAADAVASTVGNMVASNVQGASTAKSNATPMHPDDAERFAQLADAFGKYSEAPSPYAGAQFAGPGALPVQVAITFGPERSGWVYGPGYEGASSQWMPSGLIDTTQIDLNAAAFRSSLNAAPSSWDALTQQADARIAAGTYDRFSDLGHAITDDGSIGQKFERFAHALSYTRPDAAEQIAAFRAPLNPKAAVFDAMLGGGPFATLAGSAMYASGGSDQDAYYAATAVGSAGGIVGAPAGFRMPNAPQLGAMANTRRVDVPEGAGLTGVPINGATRTVPLGFTPEQRFVAAAQDLQSALVKSGITDAIIGVRGSAVTGYSLTKGTPFGQRSDIDFFVESRQLTDGYRTSRNIPGFVHPNKILPDYPLLQDWATRWTSMLGRDVTPGAFVPGTLPGQPSIVVRPLGSAGG